MRTTRRPLRRATSMTRRPVDLWRALLQEATVDAMVPPGCIEIRYQGRLVSRRYIGSTG